MDLKEVFEFLEKQENGADYIATIKGETAKLSNEAKRHRTDGDTARAKVKALLEAAGVPDDDKAVETLGKIKATNDAFAQGGKKPDEIAAQLATLTKGLDNANKQLAEMTEKANTEKAKRLNAVKTNALIEALTKQNCTSPQNVAKIITENIKVGDDEGLSFDYGDKMGLSVEDGVKAFLAENTWAVKARGSKGGGGSTGGAGGDDDKDPFLAGFSGRK